MKAEPTIDDRDLPRVPFFVVVALVVLPILFNAIALIPEVRYPTPNDNDQIFHYVFIERANQAIDAGDNPFDHWLPELEIGFPQFFYYQNLPHLTVVALYRLLFRRISLLTVLNLVRYLLLLSFPLTVYWSMRQMEFSTIAAGVGALFCSTLSSQISLGFDYNSYIWAGFGMFPQLCAMHLMFIGAACLQRVLARGTGFAAAILASSALVLSDLIYGYIFAVVALLLWTLGVLQQRRTANQKSDWARRASRLTARLAIVAVPAALITAYQTVPFLRWIQYINGEFPQYPGHLRVGLTRPVAILANLFDGHAFDDRRLPALTVLIVLGMVYAALSRRDDTRIALTIFVASAILAFGRMLLGPLIILLPLARIVPFVRFIAGVDFGAILLAGLGGELLWKWKSRIGAGAPIAALMVLAIVPFANRWSYYQQSAQAMRVSARGLQTDPDFSQILSTLRKAPAGRVYAGTRGNWGNWMTVGDVHIYDLLPLEQFDTVMPWQTLSLNSPLLWRLNLPDSATCRLFNIRYVIAPPSLRTPSFYRPLLATSNYTLYQIDSGGYIQLGRISKLQPMPSTAQLNAINRNWITSPELSEGRFIAFISHGYPLNDAQGALDQDSSGGDSSHLGLIENELFTPDSLNAEVTAASSALLVLKVTYHPGWHISIDGKEQQTFMVSPSLIGTLISPGKHSIRAEYRSNRLKNLLLILSGLMLTTVIAIRLLGFEHVPKSWWSLDE